jgi:hypothetical protein
MMRFSGKRKQEERIPNSLWPIDNTPSHITTLVIVLARVYQKTEPLSNQAGSLIAGEGRIVDR